MRSRLSMTEQVCHQTTGQNPVPFVTAVGLERPHNEQPCLRTGLRATEKWQPLDTGWVRECHMLVVRNDEGLRRTVLPTPAERLATDARVLEVAVLLDDEPQDPARSMHSEPKRQPRHVLLTAVPPRGASARLFHPGPFLVRCRRGSAEFSVFACP